MDMVKAVISRLLIGNLDITVPFPKRCFLPHLQLHAPYFETQNLTTIIAWMILLLGYSCKCVFCFLSTLTTFTPMHAIRIMASPINFSNALPSKTKPLIDLHTELFTPAMYYRLAVLRNFVHCYIIYVCTFNVGCGRSRDRIPVVARFSVPAHTGPGAHPAFCKMGIGSFQGVMRPRGGFDHPPHLIIIIIIIIIIY
jgi:hypothetical protein